MASAFDDRFALRALPQLQAEHGSEVQRLPRGQEEYAVTIANVLWAPTQFAQPESSMQVRGQVVKGSLTVESGVEVEKTDHWIIAGVEYVTTDVGHDLNGVRYIQVQKHVNQAISSRLGSAR